MQGRVRPRRLSVSPQARAMEACEILLHYMHVALRRKAAGAIHTKTFQELHCSIHFFHHRNPTIYLHMQVHTVSRLTDLVGLDEVPDVSEFLHGEHEPYIPLDAWQDLLQVGVLVQVPSDGLAHGRILPHDDHTPPSQGDANLLHLLGSHIVHVHQEEPWVLIQERLEPGTGEV